MTTLQDLVNNFYQKSSNAAISDAYGEHTLAISVKNVVKLVM